MVIFAMLFRRCPTLWKSTLKTTALFRRCLTLFNSTLKYTTLLNVVDFNVDVCNVVSTLIWRCATSRRHINLKATLNRRWNVCWAVSLTTLRNVFFNLKFQMSKHGMSCTLEKIIMAEVSGHRLRIHQRA